MLEVMGIFQPAALIAVTKELLSKQALLERHDLYG